MIDWDEVKPDESIPDLKLADFVLTGSGVFGPQRPGESDIDIVLARGDADRLLAFVDKKRLVWHYTVSDDQNRKDYTGFYFYVGDLKFDIIVARTPEEFETWRKRTNAMKKIPPIRDRELRIKVFRGETPFA